MFRCQCRKCLLHSNFEGNPWLKRHFRHLHAGFSKRVRCVLRPLCSKLPFDKANDSFRSVLHRRVQWFGDFVLTRWRACWDFGWHDPDVGDLLMHYGQLLLRLRESSGHWNSEFNCYLRVVVNGLVLLIHDWLADWWNWHRRHFWHVCSHFLGGSLLLHQDYAVDSGAFKWGLQESLLARGV